MKESERKEEKKEKKKKDEMKMKFYYELRHKHTERKTFYGLHHMVEGFTQEWRA